MTDLVLGARFDVTGDDKLVGQIGAAEIKARGLETALEQTGQGARSLGAAVDGAGNSLAQASGKARTLDSALDDVAQASGAAAAGAQALATAQNRQAVAGNANAASVASQRAGYQQLGFQMQDVFQQVALGINPLVILAQQGGQTASAVSMMGGRFAGVATFLSGPWGAAVFGAATIVGFMVQSLFEATDAASAAEAGADGLAQAQSSLGGIFDLTTGKIKDQNEVLILNARLMAINLRSEALAKRAAANDTFGGAGQRSLLTTPGAIFSGSIFNRDNPNSQRQQRVQDLVRGVRSGTIERDEALQTADKIDYTGLRITKQELQQAILDDAVADLNEKAAGLIDASLDSGNLSPELRRDAARRNPSRPSGSNALANFGESAGEKVQRLLDQYDPAPRGIDKAMQDLREIDRLIAELGERKPPDFAATIASAEQARAAIQVGLGDPIDAIADRFSNTPRDVAQAAVALGDLDAIAARLQALKPPNLDELLGQLDAARTAVRESLVAPFADLLADQERSITLLQLAVEGRREEAEQLDLIYGLMRQVGVESTAQLATELQKRGVTAAMFEKMLGNLEVERELAKAAEHRLDIERQHLQEVDTLRGSVERAFADLPRRGIRALGDFAGNLQSQASDYLARYLTETIFGGVFQQLEDQLSGRDQVRKANQAYVGEVGAVVNALRALEDAAYDAAAAQGGEIVVNAPRDSAAVDNPFDTRLKSPRELFGEMIEPLLSKLGLGPDLAKRIGESVGVALEGAAYGQMASASILGSKGNNTTAAIGGALGQVAGEELGKVVGGTLGKFLGPLGGIAGGVLGGLVGGLFKKASFGTASLSGPDDMSVQARGDGRAKGASSLGGSVQSALAGIAEALDAEIGAFNVSIGTYKDRIKVSSSGRTGSLKNKFGDVTDFRDDEAGALAFAIADAIGDGAIKGVSAAVQKALRSSEDIQEAVEEALAVREVEDILGGLADDWRKELRAFEKMGAERLRIGREYGFDLIELEKYNAQERAKLVEDILKDRVGPLKALLEDLSFGDLAEGTLADRRQKLLGEIAKAEEGATKGDEGAVDQLAQLQRQLLELSYEAFGTAGAEYGSDRDQVTSTAERIIKLEEDRVKAAQAELTTRLDQGNALTNETNNILAQIQANLERFGDAPSGGGAAPGGGRGFDTSRQVEL